MLKDPFLLNAEHQNTKHLLSLEPLRFLAHFYTTAGLPRPAGAEPYEFLNDEPTWERSHDNNFRGHMFGHYMSALALAYDASDDNGLKAQLLDRITTCITELKKCQDAFAQNYPTRAGYIGPFGDGRLDALDGISGGIGMPTSGQVWVPWYNLHKVLAGLMAVHVHVQDDCNDGNDKDCSGNCSDGCNDNSGNDSRNDSSKAIGKAALEIAKGFGEYFYNVRASMYTDENRKQVLHIEYGGMNDAFYELYRLTGDERFKTCAEYFDEVSLFNALAEGRNVLPGKHANTQIPKFIGALKRYTTLTQNPDFYAKLTDKEQAKLPKYLQAAENFFDTVLAGHTYITGGNSVREHFHAPNTLAETINRDDTHETCNGHNMLKLARGLFEVTKNKKYADYYENAFYNVILSSQNPETGAVTYFQPMGTGYNKLFGKNRFWCCNGTGIESFAKLHDSIYFTDNKSDDFADNESDGRCINDSDEKYINDSDCKRIYVNMYFTSSFTSVSCNIKLEQTANMPNDDTVYFTVDSIDGGAVASGTTLCFRVPSWCTGSPLIKINGTPQTPNIVDGYITIASPSKDDKFQLSFPMSVSLDALADNPNIVAFRYGPVVLSAGQGDWNMTATSPNGIMVLVAQRDPNAANMLEITNGVSASHWKEDIAKNLTRIKDSSDGQIQFKLSGTNMDEKLVYTPHYKQYKQRYALYITLADADYKAKLKAQQAAEDKVLSKENATAYLTGFDNHAYEGEYNMQSNNSGTGMYDGRSLRHAQGKDSWFSYDLPITQGKPNNLNVLLAKADNGRKWDMYINDEFFATETVTNTNSGTGTIGNFYVSTHQIPDKFTTTAPIKTKHVEGKTIPYITIKFQPSPSSPGNLVGGIFGVSITPS